MLKRFIPIISVVAIVLCCIAAPVNAANSRQVLDYRDYIITSNYDDVGRRWDYFQIPPELCVAQTIDERGVTYCEPGVFYGDVVGGCDVGSTMSFGVYWPGGILNDVYLDATHISSGSKISCEVQFTLNDSAYQAAVGVKSRVCVHYFDANYNWIGYQATAADDWIVDYEQITCRADEVITISKPDGAVYMGYYMTFNMEVLRSNEESEVVVTWQVGHPRLEVCNLSSPSAPGTSNTPNGVTDDAVLWLRNVASSFLEFEIAPGFSFNKVIYVVLVVGVLIWFLKIIS